jgi:cyanophycin synthetase
VRSADELRRAVFRASRSDERVVIERQAPGDVYRLLFLDGELLDEVRRLSPRVVGDGRSTIDELIAAENLRRVESRGRAGLDVLVVDLDCVFTLERAGLGLRSVPAAGETVAVKTVSNENRAEDNETLPGDALADGLVEEARAAARAVGVRLAGVDLITPDPTRSLREAGGALIEVNGTPGLHHHYLVADPAAATKVAVPVLRHLLGA